MQLLKKQFFGIYFALEKVSKINSKESEGLSAKDLKFNKLQNYFLKENYMEYVHGSYTGSGTDPLGSTKFIKLGPLIHR
jgi:hypothetical protein